MSVISATANYVKFIRGTPTAYNNLVEKDADTLYFVCPANSDGGALYLGTKLIGGASSLSQLSDIAINAIGNRQVLTYDLATNSWINTSIEALIGQMQGASSTTAGASGLVPQPLAGDQNKFLRGDGTWATVNLEGAVFDPHAIVYSSSNGYTIKGFSGATSGQILQKDSEGNASWVNPEQITSSISSAITNLQSVVDALANGALKRKKVNNVAAIEAAITDNPTDAERWIYMVPNNSGSSSNIYDEYMVIDGAVERISTGLSGSLDDYVTNAQLNTALTPINNKFNNYVLKTVYQAEVGDLTQLLTSQNNGDTLVDQVNDLTMRLTWYEVTDV